MLKNKGILVIICSQEQREYHRETITKLAELERKNDQWNELD